jgi:hypothetical protein
MELVAYIIILPCTTGIYLVNTNHSATGTVFTGYSTGSLILLLYVLNVRITRVFVGILL